MQFKAHSEDSQHLGHSGLVMWGMGLVHSDSSPAMLLSLCSPAEAKSLRCCQSMLKGLCNYRIKSNQISHMKL